MIIIKKILEYIDKLFKFDIIFEVDENELFEFLFYRDFR